MWNQIIFVFIFIFNIQNVVSENKTENIPMKERIHGLIDHHSLMVFSKTYCPYSKLAKRILYEKYKIYPKHILELDEENNMTEIQVRILIKIYDISACRIICQR